MSEDKNNGYILLEVIVSISIIIIVLLPFISNFSKSLYILHRTEIESQAHKLAADTVEIFKMKSVNDWSSLETYAANFSINDVTTGNDLFADDYNLVVNITDFDFDGDGDQDSNDSLLGKKINVIISYDTGSREVQVDTLLRKR